MGKRLGSHVTVDIQMVSKYSKRGLESLLLIRGIKNHQTSTKVSKIKRSDREMEQPQFLYC